MGVPKFAAWLTKKYPAMITRNCPADVHGLYIDLNGLIHPCCHDEDDPSVAARPEAEKIRQVCLAIETLVTSTKPRHVVYIATDGVAPRAKMNQQRARRYMKAATQMDSVDALGNVEGGTADAAQQEEVERDLAEVNAALQADTLYGSSGDKEAVAVSSPLLPGSDDLLQDMKTAPVYRQQPASSSVVEDDSKFDSNCISPGTEFMAKVAVAVREWVEAKLSVDEDDNDAAQGLWSGLTVVISDANTPGEGEHKLLDFLRTQASFSGFNGHGAHVVAGLDADLIFLTLSLHIPRVFILRDQKRPSSFDRRRGKGGRKNDNNKKQKHVDPSEESPAERDASSQPASESDDAEEQIITTTVEACRSYEYFDIDCVGSSIVSEISTLCGLKGFAMKCDPRHYGELIASGGYNFDRVAGKADGELKSTYIPKRPKPQRNTETTAAPMGDSGSNTDHAIKKEEGIKKETHNSESWNPCTDVSNSKIIDDFIVMAMIMGNDFIPRVPSAFCGESAMDNIMEMYVGEVLPYGYLTLGFQEINLIQLQRFFAAYAKIEAVKFRQHCIKQGGMTGPEAAAPIGAAIDSRWRKPYYDSVSIHPTKIHDACRAYVEGLRFVWRYYSTTSAAVSWSWYYPYHHGPFAADVAQFLQQQGPSVQTALPPPKLETTPPDPTTQLLCILPPTSSKLLPEVFREVMANPPEALADTFPKRWNVDYAAAFNKEHLAAVMLPFASMDGLRALVKDLSAQLSAEEQSRTRTIHFHVVLNKKKQLLRSAGEEESESDNTRSAPYAFKILGEGLRPLAADDVDWAFVDSTRADARVEYWALAETEPQLCRPRTYSPNVAISNLSVLPDGRILRQKRASARNDPHGKSGYDKKPPAAAATSVDAARGNQKPVLIELLICAAVVAVLTAAALTPLTNCLVKMQFLAVFVTAACMAYVLGIASGGYKKGSGLQRNAIRMTYVDWQCSSCLSLNFSKNNRCFVCSAPFDATRSWALFSGRMPADLPLMEPDHRPHVVTFGLP